MDISMFIAICIVWSYILIVLRILNKSIIYPSIMHGTINAIGSLMLHSIDIEDEIWTMPVGLLSLISSLTICIIIMTTYKYVRKEMSYKP